MNTYFKNPIAYTCYVLALLFLGLGVHFEIPALEVIRHILVPYSIDITRGVGDDLAQIWRAIMLAVQLLVGCAIYLGCKFVTRGTRLAVWASGILLSLLYFAGIALGFIAPRFH